mgnify:FL=1
MFKEYNDNHRTIGGVPEGFDAHVLLQAVVKFNGPILFIARDDSRLAAMQTALRFFEPSLPVFVFPAWDCLPYDRVSPNAEVSAARMAVLATLATGYTKPFVLLTTVNAAIQRVPARNTLKTASFIAEVGRQIDESALREFFSRMGFVKAPTVAEPGDFAVRGGLIDVYPPGETGPVRLDLFGDVLEGARCFDAITQRTTKKLNRLELAPVSEVILDESSIQRFRQNYRVEFGAAGTDDPLYEAVSAGRKHQGVEHWAPFFHETMETIFDYLPESPIFLDDRATQARLVRLESIADQYDARCEALKNKSRMDSVYKPCPPDLLYMSDDAFNAQLTTRTIKFLSVLPQSTGPNTTDAGGRIGRSFAPERQQKEISLFASLADHIRTKKKDGSVVLASSSAGARERLSGLLTDQNLIGSMDISSFLDILGHDNFI